MILEHMQGSAGCPRCFYRWGVKGPEIVEDNQ